MPRDTRTAADNAAWWEREADRYNRYAATCNNPIKKAEWEEKARDARAHAATYTTTPAS